MTEHVDVRASGLDVVEAANAAQSTYDLTADAVVIGSGAGGAIAAYELAKTGKINPIPIEERPMAKASKSLDDLRDGSTIGRVILIP